MCFSAQASFTASAVLAGITLLNLRTINNKQLLPLAFVPAFFAIQQFSEGVLWLTAAQHFQPAWLANLAQNSYLFFAFVFWPLWIPFCLAILEKVVWRKIAILLLQAGGVLFSLYMIKVGLEETVHVSMYQHSLQYVVYNVPSMIEIYAAITLLPCYFSSLKSMWIFGVLATVSFFLSLYFYEQTFTSVWCFFSAVISISLYKVLRDNTHPAAAQPQEKY